MAADEITVTVVDDHPAILVGIEHWYAAAPTPIRVVASGSTVKAAWTPPGDSADVVVFDLQLSSQGAPSLGDLRRLVDAGRRVIVYTMREDEQVALTCLDLGAFTFLTKTEGADHLVAATLAAGEDRPYTPPALAGAFSANTRSDRPKLSVREEEVLVEWFQCESRDLVAQRLDISAKTVTTYLDRVRLKYANVGRPARSKAALMARAIQDGLVQVDDL
ncbi:DNA-binding response regulator [Prauserella cavernicola]|uniref:Response regulator transcription factor n=1 Tax=Prauserella cavernicola TaxID=2800127 RepID=A0A934QMS1_9PSEU|nr:response regulator [Prauserella cavernicola]MBK1783275.1 response regulator transcription factor [Prauserella cavernicola]